MTTVSPMSPDGATTVRVAPKNGRAMSQESAASAAPTDNMGTSVQIVSTATCVGMREREPADERGTTKDSAWSQASIASELDAKRQLALQEIESRGPSKDNWRSENNPLNVPQAKFESKLLQRRKSGVGGAGLGLTIDPTKFNGASKSSPPALQTSGEATPKLRVTTAKIYALDDLPASPKRTLGPPGEIPANFNRNRRGSAPF